MRKYELTVVLSPQLNGEDVKKAAGAVEAVVEKVKGKVEKKEEWGKKELAYPIKKQTEGIYVLFNVELAGKELVRVDKELKLMDDILRFLIVGV